MKVGQILVVGLVILVFILGCTSEKTGATNIVSEVKQTHSLAEYITMSNSGNYKINMNLDVSSGDYSTTLGYVDSHFDGYVKQAIDVNGTSLGIFYKDNIAVMCLENIDYIMCLKFLDNATNFVKNGIGYDDALPSNADITFLGTETHDSMATDCFMVHPQEGYVNDRYKEFGSGQGNALEADLKLCYGISDGVLRLVDGSVKSTSKLTETITEYKLHGEIKVLGAATIQDITSPVSFAIGDVDCMEDDSITVEIFSLSWASAPITFDGITFANKTISLPSFMELLNVKLSVTDKELYDTAYAYEYSQGQVCDGDYCMPILCS